MCLSKKEQLTFELLYVPDTILYVLYIYISTCSILTMKQIHILIFILFRYRNRVVEQECKKQSHFTLPAELLG